MGFPGGSLVKNLPAAQETWVWSLGQEDYPGEGNGYPLQYSCLVNSMDRGAWWATVRGVAKSRIRQSDLTHTRKSIFFKVLFGALGYVNYQILPRMRGKQAYPSQLRNQCCALSKGQGISDREDSPPTIPLLLFHLAVHCDRLFLYKYSGTLRV